MSKTDSKNIKKSEAPMPTSMTETTEKSKVGTGKLDLKSAKEEVLAEKGIEITKPIESPVTATETPEPVKSEPAKEVKIVKPSINKIPKVVTILEKSDESVVSVQPSSTGNSESSDSPKVSFSRKSTGNGENISNVAPADLSSKISLFESFVLRHCFKSRAEAETLSKSMLGDGALMLTGKNPNEIYFEYEGVRIPSSGIFPIR